jgi:hypothetical protein
MNPSTFPMKPKPPNPLPAMAAQQFDPINEEFETELDEVASDLISLVFWLGTVRRIQSQIKGIAWKDIVEPKSTPEFHSI